MVQCYVFIALNSTKKQGECDITPYRERVIRKLGDKF